MDEHPHHIQPSAFEVSDRADIFAQIGRVLTSSLNPREVYKRVMQIIGDYFSPRNWSLLLIDEASSRFKFEIAMGIDGNKLKDIYLERNEGIVGWVCSHGKPLLIEDAQNDPRFCARIDEVLGFKTRAVVCVPLLNGNNAVIGAIELINKVRPPSAKSRGRGENNNVERFPTSATFTGEDMKILCAIGSFTGIAAENAFLHQKVRELALIDPLTRIHNRHYFNEIFTKETERVRRYGHSVCVLMIDADNFKRINDRFGHLTGDKVLWHIAQMLKASVRESDFLARFGGDEFIVLMPYADKKMGLDLARRIQTRIGEWNKAPEIDKIELSLSIGVHAAGPENLDTLLWRADQELYQYKSFRKMNGEFSSE